MSGRNWTRHTVRDLNQFTELRELTLRGCGLGDDGAEGTPLPDKDKTGRKVVTIDLDDVRKTGAFAVVVGKAIYEGAFTVEEALARARARSV